MEHVIPFLASFKNIFNSRSWVFMNLFYYLLKNSVLRLLVYGVGILSAFFVTPHILQSMGIGVYGIWALISSLTSYYAVFNFANSGSISAVSSKINAENNRDRLGHVWVAALQLALFSLLCTLFITLIYYFIADTSYMEYIDKKIFTITLFVFAFGVSFANIINVSHGFLAGRMEWNILSITAMIKLLFGSACTLLFLHPANSIESNLFYLCLINSFSLLLEACLNLFFIRKHLTIEKDFFFTNPFKSELFKVSSSLSVTILGSLLRNSTQVYLINFFLSSVSVTLYAVTKQIISYISDLMASVFGIMTPYFSKLQVEKDTQGSQAALLQSIFLSYNIASIASLGLIFYGNCFFQRWLGNEFSSIQALLIPMALASLLELGPLASSCYLIGIQQQKLLAKMTIYEGILTIILSILGLYFYNLPGIGWGIFISSLFFRTFWLPQKVCSFANISYYKYYKNLFLAIAPICTVQYIYYCSIKDYIIAEYTSILLLGMGQSLVAMITLLIVAKFMKAD